MLMVFPEKSQQRNSRYYRRKTESCKPQCEHLNSPAAVSVTALYPNDSRFTIGNSRVSLQFLNTSTSSHLSPFFVSIERWTHSAHSASLRARLCAQGKLLGVERCSAFSLSVFQLSANHHSLAARDPGCSAFDVRR